MSPAPPTATRPGRLGAARDMLLSGPPSVGSGPRLCAVARLPYWYHGFRGRDMAWPHGLHARYGPADVDCTAPAAENPQAADFHIQPLNGALRGGPERTARGGG